MIETLSGLASDLFENWQGYLLIATSAVTLAAAITALTPTPKDDAFVARIRGVLDKLALNVRHAKNAPKDPKDGEG